MRIQTRASRDVVSLAAISYGLLITTNASAQATATDQSSSNPQSLEEVMVTASRRETTVRDAPTAISAYGGDQLAKEHIQTVDDLVTRSPNIQFGANGTNTNIAIRGIGTNLQGAANDPGVAFHIDGAYVADPGLALATLLDVNRVEILRGPQGTLFGRNATGGTVNVISNAPTTERAYGFNTSVGVPAGGHIEAFVSGPLNSNGTLLGRTAVERTYQEGDVENVEPTGPQRLNDKNNYAARLQLEWHPADSFSARLQGSYQASDTAGSPYYLVGAVNHALPAPLSNTFIARPGDDKIGVGRGDTELTEKSAALFLDWDVGIGSFQVMASRRRTENFRRYDGDGTPVLYIDFTGEITRETTNAELLFSSEDTGRFSYILGANYYNDDALQFTSTYVPFVLPPPIETVASINTESFAVFAHAEHKLTEAWKVFGGVRSSTDRKQMTEDNNLRPAPRSISDEWSKPTFEIGTSYDFAPRATGYLKYSTGYKGGGFSAGAYAPSFSPETNSMWEAGLKGSFFDGSLEANLALFRISYNDLQVFQITGLITRVSNAAAASINGAEVELVQHITPELRFEFGGGWLDAKFDEFFTADSARPELGTLNLAGNTLPSAPELTLGGGPVYAHDLANGGALTLAARYDWKSRVYFSEFNLDLVAQKPSGRLSAYANYDLPGGQWQVGVYGRNLTDEATFGSLLVYSAVLNSITAGTLYPSREFGLQVRYRY